MARDGHSGYRKSQGWDAYWDRIEKEKALAKQIGEDRATAMNYEMLNSLQLPSKQSEAYEKLSKLGADYLRARMEDARIRGERMKALFGVLGVEPTLVRCPACNGDGGTGLPELPLVESQLCPRCQGGRFVHAKEDPSNPGVRG